MEAIKRIFTAATAAVSPKTIVKDCLKIEGDTLLVSNNLTCLDGWMIVLPFY